MKSSSVDECIAWVDGFIAGMAERRQLWPVEVMDWVVAKFNFEWIYHSNAIAGNSLTLRETQAVVHKGKVIGRKSMREQLEASNHDKAIRWIRAQASPQDFELDQQAIKDIHQLLFQGIDDLNAGRYRSVDMEIAGAAYTPPGHRDVEEKMAELMRWYRRDAQLLHPIKRAAHLHTKFAGIHPFPDGNGRTARLLLYLELMRSRYIPAIIGKEDRRAYHRALDKARVKGDYTSITCMVADGVRRSMVLHQSFLPSERSEPQF